MVLTHTRVTAPSNSPSYASRARHAKGTVSTHWRSGAGGSTCSIRFAGFGDQAEGDGGFEGGGRLVALGSRTAEALASVVAVARGRLGEVEVRAEEGAAQLVGEWAVPAWELSDDGITCDEGALGDVEGIETVMGRQSLCVVCMWSLLARSPGPRSPQRRGRHDARATGHA
jgi:hypothetical protein